MCGLAGIAGDISHSLKAGFDDLLLITQLRGRDSTGVFTVSNNNDTKHLKVLGTPDQLFDRKSYDDVTRGFPKVMAGHCRSKTIGENSVANAHPYDFDNVVGMHNGTLKSYYQMEGYDNKKTDSYALYHNIDRYGIVETMQKVDPDGAYALVWWDKVDNQLKFLRNGQRPLWFTWTKDQKAMVWCSEPWMFHAIGRKVELWNGVEKEGERQSPYIPLPADTLWSFNIESTHYTAKPAVVLRQKMDVKAEGKKPAKFTQRMGFGKATVTTRVIDDKGGEVANPFSTEKDKKVQLSPLIEGILERFEKRHGHVASNVLSLESRRRLKEALDDPLDDVSSPLEESTTTPISAKSQEKASPKISDFRPESMRGKSSSKKTLSLPRNSSKDSPQRNREKSFDCSGKSSCPEPKLVDTREVLGTQYITDVPSGAEITIGEFESRTGGKCSYCHTPIGGLEEVGAFLDRMMSRFVCTSCQTPPKIAIVG